MESVNHKCPSCCASLEYNPKGKNWKCDYCGGTFSLEELKANAEKFEAAEVKEEVKKEEVKKDESIEEKKSSAIELSDNDVDEYQCKDCGARIVADKNTAATFCVYCKNTAILKGRLSNKFAPSKVIPFSKTKEDAIEAFKSIGKGKILMPKEFSDPKNIEELTGIYIPFWLYTGKVNGEIEGIGNRVTSWSSGNYRYTKTDSYHVERSGDFAFANIPVDGSVRFNDAIMNSIEPFSYDELCDFNPSYLSGFLAEKYDVESSEAKKISINRAKQSCYSELNKTINYSSFVTNKKEGKVLEENIEYVLLPVWMVNIKYDGKIHTFAMNGQTGKMIGDIPYSKGKAVALWFIVFAISFVLLALITYFV